MINGKCYICGEVSKLSKEHMPPRKAFNDCKVLLAKIDRERTKAEVRWRKEQRQGGNFEFVLCEDCNNKTGSWYGNEYVKFVKVCAKYANSENAGKMVSIQIHGLFPLLVAKEAIAIICASSGPGLSQAHPELRKLILDKYSQGISNCLRLFAYLRCHAGGRSSGVAGILDFDFKNGKSKSRIVAEFSWWPVGWILAFDDNTTIMATDITRWCNFGYDEQRSVTLELPCHWAVTAYPLDFRNPEQVIKDKEQNERASRI
jgi:hypothetical protein